MILRIDTFIFQDKEIAYTIKKHARARHVRIGVSVHGQVVVTLPLRVPYAEARRALGHAADWVTAQLKKVEERKKLQALAPIPNVSYRTHAARAKKIIVARVRELAALHGFSYAHISIKNHKSKWGSCSQKKNLNFNFRLAFMAPELLDYVIVHEFCHLKEQNHSRRFWMLVEGILPDHRRLRRLLRDEMVA